MIAPPPPDHRRLLRRLRSIERGLKTYRPTVHPTGPPPGADECLAALNRVYEAGAEIGLKEIRRVACVTEPEASAIRRYLRELGVWPYRDSRPRPAWSGAGRRRKDGGR